MTAFVAATLVALAGVLAFAVMLERSALYPVVRTLMTTVTSGVTAMLDDSLDDDAKEKAVRVAGLSLLAGAWQVAWRFALALGAVAVPVLLADIAGIVPRAVSFAVLMRADFVAGVSIVAILLAWGAHRRNRRTAGGETYSGGYGAGEKIIHALAFSGPGTLRVLARLDDWLFARTVAAVPETAPVFVTSLARGGTTALLNALHGLPGIATHRYCDMPFIAAPILWSKLAGRRRSVVERERAHGDGLSIGLQSPEAFDEVFWRLHWPMKYGEQKINLWHAADRKAEAQAFFARHFRKIVLLRRPDSTPDVRYLSKNNANIARLDLLREMFPGCGIVIALREPAAHAASLFRQHGNFSRLHAEDHFVLRYMRDIGHFEFGALHRPLAFDPGLLAPYALDDPNYWLAYWISAFEHVSRHAESLLIVTQADLRAAPNATMRALIDRLGLTEGHGKDYGTYFRSTPDPQPAELFDANLLRRATEIYDRLCEYAVR